MKWKKLKKLSVALTLAFALGAPLAPTWQGETAVCEAAKQSASGMQRIAEEWPDDAEVLLETSMGTMRGRQHENIRIFRGIPYAKPPVGEQSAMEPLHGEKLMLEINETLWGGK